MTAVFLGGSRRISRLNDAIGARLDQIIERELQVFVGDANGADKAIQQYLAKKTYARVVVFAITSRLRNNIGKWEVRFVVPPAGARGFDAYSAKDLRMAAEASCGLMLWDARSRGTLANIRNLLTQEKPVAVYHAQKKRFVNLVNLQDLTRLGLSREPDEPAKSAARAATNRDQHRLAIG